MPASTATASPAQGAVLVSQMADDERHTAAELIEILAHCRSVTASADYRMLQAASLIHEDREEEFLCEVASTSSGEAASAADFADLNAATRLGGGPRAEHGPNGLERAVADVGAILNLMPARARELIAAGSALRHRLPLTGHALATGRLDLATFLHAVDRTTLCTSETLADIDSHIAQAIFARPPMSRARFTVMIDAIIARLDHNALRRRRERAETDRNVSVRPDRHAPGQGRLSAALPMVSAAELDARLTAMAAHPHTGDPRTTGQRRADALMAMARGEQHLDCLCEQCTRPADTEPADMSGDSAAQALSASDPEPTDSGCSCSSRASSTRASLTASTFHIVVNVSTLLGLDNDPGFLDGHGIIDADTMRTLLAQAHREFIAPQAPADATRYTPSRKLQALIRTGELCCTFPGCNASAWRADLDHTTPYSHRSPDTGGKTVRTNLKPLCRFHHRIKTFTEWRDHQDPMGSVLFQSPSGHMFLGNAFTGTDLFPALRPPPQSAKHPAREHLDLLRTRRGDAHRRAAERAADAAPPPPF